MTKEPGLIRIKTISASAFPFFYFPILFPGVSLLLFMLFATSPPPAEEPKVYTEADLANYEAEPMVDQETLTRMEDNLKSYKRKRKRSSVWKERT